VIPVCRVNTPPLVISMIIFVIIFVATGKVDQNGHRPKEIVF